MKRILMILTSHAELLNTDSTTGVWIGEFTDPYYEFIDEGYSVTLASPLGGEPPVDPMSRLTEHITGSNRRFNDDDTGQQVFQTTQKLADVVASDFDALFYPGGHGPMFDLATSEESGRMIVDFLSAGKPVAAVCHGPAALIKAAELDTAILRGKKVTGYSNAEERLAFRYDTVPYHLEDRLKELGADYHKGLVPMLSHIEQDGLLITGQNPLSAGPAARALIDELQREA